VCVYIYIYIYHVVEITAVLHSHCSYEELCTLPRSINKHHFMTLDKPFKCHSLQYNNNNNNNNNIYSTANGLSPGGSVIT